MVLESHKYFKYFKKNLFNRKRLNYLILYVTSQCNSCCKMCFFHKNLNKNDDLSLEEYRKISRKLGPLSVLLLSGGEPFLRKDIREVCGTFIENNKIDTLSIPTNGILTEKIVGATEDLAARFPETAISVNPSLDGMPEYHDRIRGVKNNFIQTTATIRKLEALKKQYKNVQIIVNSVINKDNISDLKKLISYLSKFDLDYHAFEIMRGERKDKSLKLPDVNEIKDFHRLIVKNRKMRIKNIFEKIIVIGSLKYIHRIKEDSLSGKRWPFYCSAGKSILVVYPDGGVSLCELKNPIANLRDNNYDITGILNDEKTLKEIKKINENRCRCSHVCFLNASIAKERSSIFKILFYYFKDDQHHHSHIQ